MRRFGSWSALVGSAICIAVAGCDFPRDADGTWTRVRGGGVMRVGVIDNPPWVTVAASGEPGGVEADMARDFARRSHARIEWTHGTEDEEMQSLKAGSLDLVIGGLTGDTPWGDRVAVTRPYYTDTVAVGVPAGTPAPNEIKGWRVAVEQGSAWAQHLQKKHATAVQIADLDEQPQAPAGMAVAAPIWQLRKWGLTPTHITLTTEEHVLAAAPGENAWLLAWEKFLVAEQRQIGPRLAAGSPPAQDSRRPRDSDGTTETAFTEAQRTEEARR